MADTKGKLPLRIQDCGPDGSREWFHLTLADDTVIWSSENKPLMELIVARVNNYDALLDALEKYAEHLPKCEMTWKTEQPRKCTCGLEQAIAEGRK